MTDETERPEDTVRRFAARIGELEAWQTRYKEAAELWDALELKKNDQVTDALLIARVADFEKGGTALSMSTTDGVDWIIQLGMIHAAEMVMQADDPQRSDDDD